MVNLYNNLLSDDFDNFTHADPVKNNPSLGISYRLRDSLSPSPEKEVPKSYDTITKEQLPYDFDFYDKLTDKLQKISYGKRGEFYFELKVVSIPLTLSDQSNPLGNFLYTYIGSTEQLHQGDVNSKKASSLINNVGSETILWGIKNGKKPTELVFNYNFCNLQEESQGNLYTNLKWNNLDNFIKTISAINL